MIINKIILHQSFIKRSSKLDSIKNDEDQQNSLMNDEKMMKCEVPVNIGVKKDSSSFYQNFSENHPAHEKGENKQTIV
ncbi:hypothetical protein HX109_04845 [Galbibacter sp. BG1]|uniref:hypothetical protein n=1 Tax=Galbibacter sp. BG1 TaxID=1170699 RepID=UPI0015B82D4F|nr:hypothetical protein [Galbibacter sp. BG1]QLE00924.1 hypothetical protein HX109_04845 [Galbibacter sp. BG1]